MRLQMHAIHFDADQKLLDLVERKTNKLETFYDRIIDGEVFFRLDKNNQNENKVVEIKLNIPGEQLFAKDQSSSFEAAADEAVEALKRQLIKFKAKKMNR